MNYFAELTGIGMHINILLNNQKPVDRGFDITEDSNVNRGLVRISDQLSIEGGYDAICR